MPDAEKGCGDLRSIFMDNVFRRAKDRKTRKLFASAILGAHTLGSAHVEFSGYEGAWSEPEQMHVFDN